MTTPSIAVLGMCMRDPRVLDVALSMGLSPTHFDLEFERDVFAEMIEAERSGHGFDYPELAVAFPGRSIELVTISEQAPLAQNPAFYIQAMLRRAWRLMASRKLLELLGYLQTHDDLQSLQSVQDRAVEIVEHLIAGPKTGALAPAMIEVLDRVVEQLQVAIEARDQGKAIAVSSGVKSLDFTIGGGWRKKRLATLCARSGRGKTTLGLCFARNALLAGKRVVYFSTEAGPEELVEKIITNEASINGTKLTNGSVSSEETDRFMAAVSRLAEVSLEVDDRSARDIDQLEASLRRLRRRGPVDLVIVDYAQQVRDFSSKHMSKPQEVASVTSRLKGLAMELDVPIVMLAQLNRLVDKADAFPTVADIADSSAIEKDSDQVLLLHWVQDSPTTTRPILRVAKNRLGPKDVDIKLAANLGLGRFEEADR